MAYIDTSVLVACYCPEPLSDKAARTLRKTGGTAISSLVEVEFYSAVATKVRCHELDIEAARRLISLLRQHVSDHRYDVVSIGPREYALARDWLGQFSSSLRAPDALHLAAASNNDLALVTADKDLAQAAKAFGVKRKLIT